MPDSRQRVEGQERRFPVRPYECLAIWRTSEDMETGGHDLRSLIPHTTTPVVPKGRLGTIYTTRYDELSLPASLQGVS